MSYSCLEELQVDLDLDLYALDKISILSKAGCKYDDGWFVVTDDGICHLFDKDGNPDDIKKVTRLKEEHIRKDIAKIVVPSNVMSIGKGVFYSCSGLTSVTIPNSVTSIESYAFWGCSGLTSVTIPDSVTDIGNSAFYGCSSLTNVMIGSGVTSIGAWAFYDCSSLMNITIPDKVTSIGNYAFFSCVGLTSVIIPDSVTNIRDSAFYKCNALANLEFKGKTLEQVKKMRGYPWGIKDKSIIRCEVE